MSSLHDIPVVGPTVWKGMQSDYKALCSLNATTGLGTREVNSAATGGRARTTGRPCVQWTWPSKMPRLFGEASLGPGNLSDIREKFLSCTRNRNWPAPL